MTSNVTVTPEARLLDRLLAELFQSERSASRHPIVEAERTTSLWARQHRRDSC